MSENKFDIEEFKEAYSHYRHLEQERSRYLAFFFTVVSGFIAVLGFLFVNDKHRVVQQDFYLVAAIIAFFLQILTLLIFIAVRAGSNARTIHGQVIACQRKKLETDSGVRLVWDEFLPKRFSPWGVQGATEIVLHLFALLFFMVIFLASYRHSPQLSWEIHLLVMMMPIVLAVGHAAVACKSNSGVEAAKALNKSEPS